jgi:tetratricopeptide (TPR) repeat protein
LRIFGDQSPAVADVLTDMAVAQHRQHHLDESAKLYRRALSIYDTEGNRKRIWVMRGLAILLTQQRKYAEAGDLLEQTLCILETGTPVDQPELGKTKASLANLRFAQKRLDQAVVLYRESLALLEPAIGGENYQLLGLLDPYARALRATEDYAAAAAVDMRATKIRVRLTRAKQG